jgi:hypothetical protein
VNLINGITTGRQGIVAVSKGTKKPEHREPEQPSPEQPETYVAGWHDGWAVGYQAGRERRENSFSEPDETAA